MSSHVDVKEVVARVKSALSEMSTAMKVFSELMIVSEMWFENSKVHLIVWLPDFDAATGKMVFAKKHIVYDMASDRVEIRREEG